MSLVSPEDELRAEREALGLSSNGTSISQRVADAPPPEQEELFVLDQGRRKTLSQVLPPGTRVEYQVTLTSKSFRGATDMGLLDFNDPDMVLVVPVRQGKVVVEPKYDEDGYVDKVTIKVDLKPTDAHEVNSTEGRALLGLD